MGGRVKVWVGGQGVWVGRQGVWGWEGKGVAMALMSNGFCRWCVATV